MESKQDQDDVPGNKRRKRSDNFSSIVDSQSESAESTSSRSDTPIPERTSRWNSGVLDLLRIDVIRDKLYQPSELFEEWLPSVMISKCTSIEKVQKNIISLVEQMKKNKALRNLDVDSVFDIDAYPLFDNEEGEKNWNLKLTPYDVFIESLKYMVSVHERGSCETEAMYVTLFQNFVAMFGLNSISAVLTEKMTFGNTDVSSTPDILLMDKFLPKMDSDYMKILALVEAKRTDINAASNSPPDTRNKIYRKCADFTLNENLIGQHCGELLIHCQKSSNRYGMMGIILEKTNVTFSYLKCNKKQIEVLKSGNWNNEDKPSVVFSKQYNYLKKADREHLIEPLVTLSLLQKLE